MPSLAGSSPMIKPAASGISLAGQSMASSPAPSWSLWFPSITFGFPGRHLNPKRGFISHDAALLLKRKSKRLIGRRNNQSRRRELPGSSGSTHRTSQSHEAKYPGISRSSIAVVRPWSAGLCRACFSYLDDWRISSYRRTGYSQGDFCRAGGIGDGISLCPRNSFTIGDDPGRRRSGAQRYFNAQRRCFPGGKCLWALKRAKFAQEPQTDRQGQPGENLHHTPAIQQ